MAAFVIFSFGKLFTFRRFHELFWKVFRARHTWQNTTNSPIFQPNRRNFFNSKILLILQNGTTLWFIVRTQFSVGWFKNAVKKVRNSPFLQSVVALKTRFESLWNEFVATCHSVCLMRDSIFYQSSPNYLKKLSETLLFSKVQQVQKLILRRFEPQCVVTCHSLCFMFDSIFCPLNRNHWKNCQKHAFFHKYSWSKNAFWGCLNQNLLWHGNHYVWCVTQFSLNWFTVKGV